MGTHGGGQQGGTSSVVGGGGGGGSCEKPVRDANMKTIQIREIRNRFFELSDITF